MSGNIDSLSLQRTQTSVQRHRWPSARTASAWRGQAFKQGKGRGPSAARRLADMERARQSKQTMNKLRLFLNLLLTRHAALLRGRGAAKKVSWQGEKKLDKAR